MAAQLDPEVARTLPDAATLSHLLSKHIVPGRIKGHYKVTEPQQPTLELLSTMINVLGTCQGKYQSLSVGATWQRDYAIPRPFKGMLGEVKSGVAPAVTLEKPEQRHWLPGFSITRSANHAGQMAL